MSMFIRIAGAAVVVGAAALTFTFVHPPITTIQRGYRGVALEQNYLPSNVGKLYEINKAPDPEPPIDPAGTPSSETYQNVKVLGKVDSLEFLRVMASIAKWVAPVQGCTYCHNAENPAWDTQYPKIVARRMFQMVEYINTYWSPHVGKTGVTCYTCHRGNPVPSRIWYTAPPPAPLEVGGMAEVNQGKNIPNVIAGYSSLPYDPLTPYLLQANEIRVQSAEALPGTDPMPLKRATWTYALMMYMSQSLGVNCDYCHNSRALRDWSQSSPQRVTAWYGIRMVRDLNNNFLLPLAQKGILPQYRLGPTGDGPKLACATCHKGVYKPLFGVSMLATYPEIAANGQVNMTADIGTVQPIPKEGK